MYTVKDYRFELVLSEPEDVKKIEILDLEEGVIKDYMNSMKDQIIKQLRLRESHDIITSVLSKPGCFVLSYSLCTKNILYVQAFLISLHDMVKVLSEKNLFPLILISLGVDVNDSELKSNDLSDLVKLLQKMSKFLNICLSINNFYLLMLLSK